MSNDQTFCHCERLRPKEARLGALARSNLFPAQSLRGRQPEAIYSTRTVIARATSPKQSHCRLG